MSERRELLRETLLVIRYATVNDSFLACVYNDERQMNSCVGGWRTLFLFHLFVALNKVLESDLLIEKHREVDHWIIQYSRVFIGLANMVNKPLYHAQQIL